MKRNKKAAASAAPAADEAKPIASQPTVENSAAASASRAEVGAADSRFPIVGIGASAGGLKAFEGFFSGMPADTEIGMAFVLVQHLDPNHKSILRDLIQRCTRMHVYEVEDGMVVRPNCAYIIPPGRDMAFLNGALQLLEPTEPRGQRLPIDFFFRSLAQDQRERAIGIVLSGTGSDGTLGVRAIKGEGGMVMAQNPSSTEFDGMPRSAIATGLVDYELLPSEMPARLVAYAVRTSGLQFRLPAVLAPKTESSLKKLFILLRAQMGHDFSQYKPSTIFRRVERRMAVHQIETIDGYVKYLQQNSNEVETLFRNLLIGVTNFFRDPEAFRVLEEQVIPKLFAGKRVGSVIRFWVPGCSTGEEAYSLAMLLQERMEAMKQNYVVQIFATDIDRQAVATARAGHYPASIATDLSPERLARFFTAEPDGSAYRVHKSIRDLLVFSEQSVIKDPPFSKLDLISCRNLMIYLGAELQQKLIPLFHYALNPHGMLFLGTSETIGDHGDLFAALDRKQKVFQRKGALHGASHVTLSPLLPSMAAKDAPLPPRIAKASLAAKQSPRELTERALLQAAPASALVNERGDILYLHGRTGVFLEPAPGEPGLNLLKMAREWLRRDLTSTLHKALATGETACCPGVRVKTNGHFTTVKVTAIPVTAGLGDAPGMPVLLVLLEETPTGAKVREQKSADRPKSTEATTPDAKAQITALQRELRAMEEYVQSTTEELETSAEELKSTNEEMQSVNEELQSTNEELETSKEELQSVNEELTTVNAELQTKVTDLSRSNNDMNNLLAGTGIGTVFVDHQMRIMRFTPAATAVINLIPGDVGRPVGHLLANLVDYETLVVDLQSVLATLVPKDVSVRTKAGGAFRMRIQPYRTLDNVIEGAVITFVDITEMEQTREALHKANDLLRLAVVVRDAHDAITVQDLEGRIIAWNPGAVRLYGWSEAEALLMHVHDRIPAGLRDGALTTLQQLSRSEILEPYPTQRLAKNGAVMEVTIISTALLNEAGQLYAIATTERAREAKRAQTTESGR